MRKMLLSILVLTACTGIPDGLQAVNGFDINRYAGTWYEIARLDHTFERGLENISATYTLDNDGGIDVVNQGWDVAAGEWKKAEGKAYFIGQTDQARLKVSFFGPFYGGYNVIDLDKEDYSYALVAGPDRSYLWLLSRTKQLPKATLETIINKAKQWGFATHKLIFAKQQ